ncbi:MAG: hypothetical protein ACLRZF_15510 [Waltera sp.]
MEGVKEKQGQLVFGLDIGTRSIVGTVGYLNGGKFHVLAQRSKEHETRAMLDGQIHDIGKVGETISQVKEQLEADLGRELTGSMYRSCRPCVAYRHYLCGAQL